MTTDTDALARELLSMPSRFNTGREHDFAARVVSLAAELERLRKENEFWAADNRDSLEAAEAELERLERELLQEMMRRTKADAELERAKAERDAAAREAGGYVHDLLTTQARLDKALSALRRIEAGAESNPAWEVVVVARAAIAEIEGEA